VTSLAPTHDCTKSATFQSHKLFLNEHLEVLVFILAIGTVPTKGRYQSLLRAFEHSRQVAEFDFVYLSAAELWYAGSKGGHKLAAISQEGTVP
jgi:hypothetical protein